MGSLPLLIPADAHNRERFAQCGLAVVPFLSAALFKFIQQARHLPRKRLPGDFGELESQMRADRFRSRAHCHSDAA
jgi:hypothetical protein